MDVRGILMKTLLKLTLILALVFRRPSPAQWGLNSSGMITFISSGTCPVGYSEVSSTGSYVLFTSSGNGDAGTTGGSNSYTPAGSNGTVSFTPAGTNSAPAFTGTPGTVPAQVFTGASDTTSAVSAGTPGGTNGTATVATVTGSKAGTSAGAFSTIGGVSPGSSFTVPAETFTGSALATHTHTVTPTGTNGTASFTPAGTVAAPTFTGNSGTVSAQTFSGTPATIQPTFVKLIGCKKT